MKLQSIVFLRNRNWGIVRAKLWLIRHKFKPIKPPHIRGNEIRFRITRPNYKMYITKKLPNGVLLVFGIK